MRRKAGILFSTLLAIGFALEAGAVQRPPGLGDVEAVRFWSYPEFTRVVVELTHGVDVEVRRLPANQASSRPERLYIDLPEIWVGREYVDGIPVGDGLLAAVRLGQNTLEKARLVIDLDRYHHHRLLTLEAPHRVVVDVYGKRGSSAGGGAPDGRLPMPLRPVQRVVIDPGHGGKDPGAIGLGGLREKDVNLRLSNLLAKKLRANGFEVVLTRKDDTFLSLEERTAKAESSGGDLFISVHANASRRRATRGMEIYYLDASHQRHSLRVAARENGVSRTQVDSLQRTMAKLRVSEASLHANRLATLVHDNVMSSMPRAHSEFRDLGIKKGPFYVLFLSSMPSILLEAGFITNRTDAQLLRNENFLGKLADQVAAGLVEYRDQPTTLAAGGGE